MTLNPTLRIATWNLDHPKPGSRKKTPAILEKINAINADIWILTETNNQAIDLSAKGYQKFSSTENESKNADTTLWLKLEVPTQIIGTFDPDIAVCVKLNLEDSDLLIYGTIVTWHGDRGKDGTSKNWEEHYRSIKKHGDDWHQLIEKYPNYNLLIAGDFNQARDGSNWYGTQKGIELLTQQLDHNHLHCLTDQIKPINRSNIDHIFASQALQQYCRADFWDNLSENNTLMSDHNGVFVDLNI